MAASLEEKLGIKAELIRSSGGVFEVRRDGDLIFSKKKLGRFPEFDEVERLLGAL